MNQQPRPGAPQGGMLPQLQMQLQQLQMQYQMLQTTFQQQAMAVAGNPQQTMMLQNQFMQQQQMLAVQMQQVTQAIAMTSAQGMKPAMPGAQPGMPMQAQNTASVAHPQLGGVQQQQQQPSQDDKPVEMAMMTDTEKKEMLRRKQEEEQRKKELAFQQQKMAFQQQRGAARPQAKANPLDSLLGAKGATPAAGLVNLGGSSGPRQQMQGQYQQQHAGAMPGMYPAQSMQPQQLQPQPMQSQPIQPQSMQSQLMQPQPMQSQPMQPQPIHTQQAPNQFVQQPGPSQAFSMQPQPQLQQQSLLDVNNTNNINNAFDLQPQLQQQRSFSSNDGNVFGLPPTSATPLSSNASTASKPRIDDLMETALDIKSGASKKPTQQNFRPVQARKAQQISYSAHHEQSQKALNWGAISSDVSDLFKDEETVKREAEEKEKTAALQFQANLIKAQMLQQQQAAAAQQAQLQQPQQGFSAPEFAAFPGATPTARVADSNDDFGDFESGSGTHDDAASPVVRQHSRTQERERDRDRGDSDRRREREADRHSRDRDRNDKRQDRDVDNDRYRRDRDRSRDDDRDERTRRNDRDRDGRRSDRESDRRDRDRDWDGDKSRRAPARDRGEASKIELRMADERPVPMPPPPQLHLQAIAERGLHSIIGEAPPTASSATSSNGSSPPRSRKTKAPLRTALPRREREKASPQASSASVGPINFAAFVDTDSKHETTQTASQTSGPDARAELSRTQSTRTTDSGDRRSRREPESLPPHVPKTEDDDDDDDWFSGGSKTATGNRARADEAPRNRHMMATEREPSRERHDSGNADRHHHSTNDDSMLRAAEMIGKQAQTRATSGAATDFGSAFAPLDFTNSLPTLDFTIDYAPPSIADINETEARAASTYGVPSLPPHMHETESELGSVFPNRARRQSEPGDEEEENIVIVRDEDNERDTVTKSSGDDWFSEPAKHSDLRREGLESKGKSPDQWNNIISPPLHRRTSGHTEQPPPRQSDDDFGDFTHSHKEESNDAWDDFNNFTAVEDADSYMNEILPTSSIAAQLASASFLDGFGQKNDSPPTAHTAADSVEADQSEHVPPAADEDTDLQEDSNHTEEVPVMEEEDVDEDSLTEGQKKARAFAKQATGRVNYEDALSTFMGDLDALVQAKKQTEPERPPSPPKPQQIQAPPAQSEEPPESPPAAPKDGDVYNFFREAASPANELSRSATPALSTTHEQEWARLLLRCATVLATATRSFDRVVQSAGEETIEEVMHTDKTREYAKSIMEVYLVACRVSCSLNMDMPGCEIQVGDLRHAWQGLLPHFRRMRLLPPDEPVKDYENQYERDNCCGVCLTKAVPSSASSDIAESVNITEDGTPEGENNSDNSVEHYRPIDSIVRYGDRPYHVTCANLWIHEMDSELPDLPLLVSS